MIKCLFTLVISFFSLKGNAQIFDFYKNVYKNFDYKFFNVERLSDSTYLSEYRSKYCQCETAIDFRQFTTVDPIIKKALDMFIFRTQNSLDSGFIVFNLNRSENDHFKAFVSFETTYAGYTAYLENELIKNSFGYFIYRETLIILRGRRHPCLKVKISSEYYTQFQKLLYESMNFRTKNEIRLNSDTFSITSGGLFKSFDFGKR
jgi:hypothetical protein